MSGAGLIELLAARLGGRGARRAAPALREALAEVSARGANQSDPLVTVYRGGGDGQFWTPNAETAAGYGPVRRGMLDTNGFGSAEYTAEMANQSDDFGAFIQNQMARAESENLPGVTLDGIPDLPNWDIQRQYIVRDPSRLRDIAEHGPASEAAPSLRDALSKINASRTGPDAGPSQTGRAPLGRGRSKTVYDDPEDPSRVIVEMPPDPVTEAFLQFSRDAHARGLPFARHLPNPDAVESAGNVVRYRTERLAPNDTRARVGRENGGFFITGVEDAEQSGSIIAAMNALDDHLRRTLPPNTPRHFYDLGPQNFMRRADGTLVINDPVESTGFAAHTAPDGGPVQAGRGAERITMYGPDETGAYTVEATVDGKLVGRTDLFPHEGGFAPEGGQVIPAFQRQGVMSRILQHAEQEIGASLRRPMGMTDEGRAMWEQYASRRTAPNAGPAQTVGALPSATSEGVTTYRGENTHVRIQPFPRRGVTEVTWDVNGGRAPSGLADRARLEQEGIDTALRAMQQHAAQNGDVTYTVHGANGALARRYRRMAQERAEAAGFTFEETPSGGLIFRRADRDNRIDGNALQRALRDRMKRE